MTRRSAVLSIAGSDSGGGAGIQADIRTISSFGVHAATALTAITAQNSRAVVSIESLSDEIIERQIDAVMEDLQPAVIKIGMLGEARIVELVARKMRQWKPAEIVLDPVMIASSGATLLAEDAIDALREQLLPLATILTPNWPEAGALINAHPRGLQDLERIAISFARLGVHRVLLKGGHLEGDEVIDTLIDHEQMTQFSNRRIRNAEGHGTGCALASAIAALRALGRSYEEACSTAIAFVHGSLERRYETGGSKPLFLDLGGVKPE